MSEENVPTSLPVRRIWIAEYSAPHLNYKTRQVDVVWHQGRAMLFDSVHRLQFIPTDTDPATSWGATYDHRGWGPSESLALLGACEDAVRQRELCESMLNSAIERERLVKLAHEKVCLTPPARGRAYPKTPTVAEKAAKDIAAQEDARILQQMKDVIPPTRDEAAAIIAQTLAKEVDDELREALELNLAGDARTFEDHYHDVILRDRHHAPPKEKPEAPPILRYGPAPTLIGSAGELELLDVLTTVAYAKREGHTRARLLQGLLILCEVADSVKKGEHSAQLLGVSRTSLLNWTMPLSDATMPRSTMRELLAGKLGVPELVGPCPHCGADVMGCRSKCCRNAWFNSPL
jgi:hypothetical protein